MVLYMVGYTFMSIGDAAGYLGVSIQTLRRWDAAGKLKSARHPASKYRYYQMADLKRIRDTLSAKPEDTVNVGRLFQEVLAHIEGNDLVREPQQDAHRTTKAHFAKSNEPAILQIPVGCGKTGVMATIPFGVAAGRVLVITPNLTILKGVAAAL